VAIAVTGSYRALFLLGGAATLAALVPLALSPSPQRGARLTLELAGTWTAGGDPAVSLPAARL
jgi:hypothetical protein